MIRILRVHLRPLALKENRAVLVRTQDVIRQRTLTPLAARPQPVELHLSLTHTPHLVKVQLRLTRLAVRAHGRTLILERRTTPQALHRLDRKLHERTHIRRGDL